MKRNLKQKRGETTLPIIWIKNDIGRSVPYSLQNLPVSHKTSTQRNPKKKLSRLTKITYPNLRVGSAEALSDGEKPRRQVARRHIGDVKGYDPSSAI